MDAVSEFDEKLNALLSDPGKMAQIMQMAQSISGGEDSPPTDPPPPLLRRPSKQRPTLPPLQPGRICSPPGERSGPEALMRLLPLIQELGGQRDSNARHCCMPCVPYLKPGGRKRWERALQLPGCCSIWAKIPGWVGGVSHV